MDMGLTLSQYLSDRILGGGMRCPYNIADMYVSARIMLIGRVPFTAGRGYAAGAGDLEGSTSKTGMPGLFADAVAGNIRICRTIIRTIDRTALKYSAGSSAYRYCAICFSGGSVIHIRNIVNRYCCIPISAGIVRRKSFRRSVIGPGQIFSRNVGFFAPNGIQGHRIFTHY